MTYLVPPQLAHTFYELGTHANSAFSFSLMVEYAIISEDYKLLNRIKDYSIKNFMMDKNCPVSYEPSGTDFLSPCLAEASLMSTLLNESDFNNWFKKFIPSLDKKNFANIINPPTEQIKILEKLIHLDHW